MKNDTKKKVFAIAGAIGIALAGGAIGYAIHQPDTEIVKVPYQVEKIVTKEVPVEVIKEVIVTETVTVEDNAFLNKICDRMMFDDLQECKEQVAAEDAALKLALDLLEDESELFDFLEEAGLIEDEKDARVIKLYKEFDDVEVVESDFDDEEYEFVIKAKIEDEDAELKKTVLLTVKIEDGEAELTDASLDE
jgi:dihydroxyacetone kinase-like predicted kinase